MKEIMLTVLKYIKLSEFKKAMVFMAILFCKIAPAQDIVIKEPDIIQKSLAEYKMNIPMMEDVELKNKLYKLSAERTYKQKAKTSMIIGLSLLPPAFLFSQLAKPNDPYSKYKLGWGAAGFAAVSTSLFYLIRSIHFTNKHNKRMK